MDEVWQGRDRDRALRLSWRCNEYEFAKRLDLPLMGSAKNVRAIIAVAIDAVYTARHFPELRISCSRRNGWWHETRRYRDPDFTYYNVVPAIDALVDAGILVDYDLQPAGRATGIQSSCRPAPWLADVALPDLRYEVGEVIRMKDIEGHLVDYRDNDRTRRDRAMLTKINRCLADADIGFNVPAAIRDGNAIHLDGYAVFPSMTALYRVYKGGWDRGGRFYGGWWQSCRKTHRQHLTIDGQRTVELDYQQIHPRLLYGLAGLHLEGDAYTIPGWDRDVVKKGFNTLLNTQDFPEARGAIAKNLGVDRDTAEWLILDITTRHPDIKSYFHSGIGMSLQNIDSEICRQVLVAMYRKGIVALPVHDSFVVPEEHEDTLSQVMRTAFDAVAKTARKLF
ncbi:hypothetical protein EPK99_20030 [Neorhizobium lilium]|uniref:DNA-directed DNA polymerase family A palm domain-containing protein n=1 Tax=Neorhizobium lilium TaxID=2503024 RepID=A0A444LDP7_9HYPH|nr:hypothetical protein [Neorhizobium lilium]RWX75961.1 hypothetical protein EPK99_20030 [Neorhizobium lilium]